jgi:hypothetical protein
MVVLGELLIVGRERDRSSQRYFLGLGVLQTKAIAWTGRGFESSS